MGESFWAFLPRTVIGSLRSAWGLERVRFDRLGAALDHPQQPPQRLDDDRAAVRGADRHLRLDVVPYLLCRWCSASRCSRSSTTSSTTAAAPASARTDATSARRPEHSWNTNNVASNVLLYHLQRHSDHHANPMRRYQALRHFDEAPQLPTGYAGMIVLALVPPLWRR